MSDIEIRSLNGHKLVDEVARQKIEQLQPNDPFNKEVEPLKYLVSNRNGETEWDDRLAYQYDETYTFFDIACPMEYDATADMIITAVFNYQSSYKPPFDTQAIITIGDNNFVIPTVGGQDGASTYIWNSDDYNIYISVFNTYEQQDTWIINVRINNASNIVDVTAETFHIAAHVVESVIKTIDRELLPQEVNSNIINGSAEGSLRTINSAEENKTYTIGENALAVGFGTKATGKASHAEGFITNAEGRSAHSEGQETFATGYYSHAEGKITHARGESSHAEGYAANAIGDNSHAEGVETVAEGEGSHAEGGYTDARGNYSHSEGEQTHAINTSHAEGYNTYASNTSHTEGFYTVAMNGSHAEGRGTFNLYWFTGEANATVYQVNNTTGLYIGMPFVLPSRDQENGLIEQGAIVTVVAFDDNTKEVTMSQTLSSTAINNKIFEATIDGIATGQVSHVEGIGNVAMQEAQHVQGKYNILNDSGEQYSHIVGNGTASDNRSNAHTLDWSGNAWYSGDVYVGSTSGTNKDEGSKKLATEEYVAEEIANIGNTLALHPIGSIYMSVNETSPAELFGGTWEQLKNRFLLGISDAHPLGEEGGSETHTLTISEMPSHTHTYRRESSNGSGEGINFAMNDSGKYKTDSGYTNSSGGNGAHNNMPPYLAVNMWKRVA